MSYAEQLTTRQGGLSVAPPPLRRWGRLVDRVSFELVYDGPALSEHQMDVRDLVPALTGVGNLIRDANRLLNKDLADVRVLVNSEHKRGCFSISLELWQSLYDAAKGLLGAEGVKNAKDILEWLDLIVPGGAVGALGIFGYYRWRAGRKLATVQSVHDAGPGGIIQITVEGDNNPITISPIVFQLAHDHRIAKDAAKLLAPLKESGIEEVKTMIDGVPQLQLNKDEAKAVLATCALVKEEEDILSKGTIVAHLTPYDAQFDADAKQWEFWHGDRRIPVDISETSIARDAVERRSVSMDDVYKVDLEITERKTPSGQIRTEYKIKNVHDRFSGPRQDKLFEPPEESEA